MILQNFTVPTSFRAEQGGVSGIRDKFRFSVVPKMMRIEFSKFHARCVLARLNPRLLRDIGMDRGEIEIQDWMPSRTQLQSGINSRDALNRLP